jgi:hypothetical protein
VSKWTAICIIGVVFAIFGAIASANFAYTSDNNTTTIVCPKGMHGSAGNMNGHVVVVCSSR